MYSEEDGIKSISCFCQGLCPYGMEYGTCETKPGGKCFTSVELDLADDGREHPVLSYGCLPPNELALFQCRATFVVASDGKNIKCCDEYDLCNKHLLPIIEKTGLPEVDYFHSTTVRVLLGSITICLVFFIAGMIITYLKIKKEISKRKRDGQDTEAPTIQMSESNNGLNGMDLSIGGDSGIRIGAESSESNAESSDLRSKLVQRTISKQITFELMIASGTFTEVWRAKWRDENVAVKIYRRQGKQYWIREIEMFQTPLLRHEHILGYIAADVKDYGLNSRMYLITEYHSHGSLRDYLKNHTVSPVEFLQMTKGLASALSHMHTEIFGSSRKPCITHNNINSTNILVKRNKDCCFGDFSKAVRYFSSLNSIDAPDNILNSDVRYLAPEFLEKSFNPNIIESYKMGDIYSFSLILWEIINRCEKSLLTPATMHQVPYEAELSAEDQEYSWENVAELVARKEVRPRLKNEWAEDRILKSITKVMVECWSATPSVRLTCLRIKKTLFKIRADNA